jgi:hypothetical protein
MTTHLDDGDTPPALGPFGTAAPTYYRAGWPVFPVVGKAINIPRGITGRAGAPIEYSTVVDWMFNRPDDNIAVRLVGIIGIDIDAYDKDGQVKRGDETLTSAEHLWGQLPPTWRSTSREPGNPSGIRFYRVPKGMEFRTILALPNADGEMTGDVEICQQSHRYAVVWPSIHPDTSTVYRWYTPDGVVATGPPDALALPALPGRWIEELTLIRPAVDERLPAPVTAQLALPADWHPKVTEHYQDGLNAVGGPVGSRHDNTLQVVGALARDESRGRTGATTALGLLRERFVAAIGDERQRDPAREFESMLEGSRTLIATTVSTVEAERDAVLAVFANAPLAPTDPAPLSGPPRVAELGPTDDPWAGFGAWAPADIAIYLDPAWRPEPPTILRRTDGRALFYAANVNWLFGASGEGKTWVALIAVAQEINAGRHVVWLHYEDPLPDKLVHRLVLLGVAPDDIARRFHVVCTSAPLQREGVPFLRAITAHYGAVLVVIDSIGEALGADGIAVKDDERFVVWLHATVRVFAADGQTLIGIDHLPMGEPGRLDPVGSFRKKAATTGSMFLATSPKSPTQERAGVIKLTTAKDRSGFWTKGETAAVVHLGPNGIGGLAMSVEAPRVDAERNGEPESIVLARHTWRAVKKRGQLNQRGLLAAMTEVKGSDEAKKRGIDFAVLQGWLVESNGPRSARVFDLGETVPPSAADLLQRWNDES